MATKYFNFNNEQNLFPIDVNNQGQVTIKVDDEDINFDTVQEFAENYAVARNVATNNLKNWTLVFDDENNTYSFILKAGTAGADNAETDATDQDLEQRLQQLIDFMHRLAATGLDAAAICRTSAKAFNIPAVDDPDHNLSDYHVDMDRVEQITRTYLDRLLNVPESADAETKSRTFAARRLLAFGLFASDPAIEMPLKAYAYHVDQAGVSQAIINQITALNVYKTEEIDDILEQYDARTIDELDDYDHARFDRELIETRLDQASLAANNYLTSLVNNSKLLKPDAVATLLLGVVKTGFNQNTDAKKIQARLDKCTSKARETFNKALSVSRLAGRQNLAAVRVDMTILDQNGILVPHFNAKVQMLNSLDDHSDFVFLHGHRVYRIFVHGEVKDVIDQIFYKHAKSEKAKAEISPTETFNIKARKILQRFAQDHGANA